MVIMFVETTDQRSQEQTIVQGEGDGEGGDSLRNETSCKEDRSLYGEENIDSNTGAMGSHGVSGRIGFFDQAEKYELG